MKEQELEEILEQVEVEELSNLIIYNDDINDYRYVIFLLETICELTPIRAEQCTLISHHTGKCHVRKGSKSDMTDMMNKLMDNGLGASVESVS